MANLTEVIGESDTFLEFEERLSRVARVERPVLLIGERGSGKELAASRLHYHSQRWEGALVTLNSAALSPSVVEAELFGHERGAFTGAERRRAGRFESAAGGTLFLDELSLVPLSVQEKLLRVVEYGTFERVGSSETVEADVRLIGATNVDLPALVSEGHFKADLLDRLSFEVLYLPPLRERKGDIAVLARHFAQRMGLELGLSEPPVFSVSAMRALERHPWYGNIRELRNVVERAVYRHVGKPRIEELDFTPFAPPWELVLENVPKVKVVQMPSSEAKDAPSPKGFSWQPGSSSFSEAVSELERYAVGDALRQAHGHRGKAAARLQLSYDQFRHLLRKHKLPNDDS